MLTATDGSSNTANCNFNVVVSDNTNPTITCPGNQVGSVDASCNFSLPDYTSLATAADNCPGVTVTQVPAPGTNVGVGTTNIVLTATDASSNTANCNFNVVVSDNTNPTITCPGNQVGSVDASCNFSLPDYTSLATAADNCPGVTVTQVPAPGTNVGVGTTNIVLTATDGNSNTANCNFDVVVSDNTNPTITCPGNQVGSVDASCNFSLPDYTSLATAADNCPGVTVTQVPAPGTNVGVGTTNIVLTATDGNSNTANCNFDVVVSDNTNPTITCPGNQVGSVDASCNFSLPDYTSLATANDNCPGVTVTQVPAPGTNVGIGTTNIVLTATDGNSNTANCNFDVVVSDNTNPTITCPGNQLETPDVSCNFTLPDYTSLATPADNCPGVTVTQSPAPGTVVSANTTIILTATDASSNTANCTFDVIINDVTAPTAVCQNITVYLDGSGNATITAADIDGGSSDNCAGLALSASQTAFTCADIGANNVTLTATDGNSNTDNCVAVVTVADTTSPTAVCQNITVYLDGAGNATITAADLDNGSTDNCGIVTLSASQTAFTCADIGANSVTLTVTDGNSNISTCTSTVTVQDTVSPTAVCQNITVYLDGAGNATITSGDIDGGSSDNCGAVTLSASQTAFTCADAGANNVTLTVTDGNANVSSCVAVVTVSDTVSPTAVCQNVDVYLDAAGNASIVAADVDGGSTDNCGTVTLSASPNTFSCADLSSGANNLVITGLYDGPLPGGLPKGVELYVLNDIADLSQYGLGSANNGGGTDGEEFTFPAVAVTAGQYIYVSSEATEFNNFFGFAPDYTTGAMLINGDDAVELFYTGGVIDVFGDINVDGTGQPWEYLDGWAYRNNNTGPDGTSFALGSWSFSGINVFDLQTSNASAPLPIPIGTYMYSVASAPVDVTLTVTDGSSNIATCTATVTVHDTVSPTITCPGNQVETPDASCNFTLPDYTALVTASDNCTTPSVTQTPAVGTVISGITTITMTATDGAGNISTCTFDVDLVDATAPTAVCQNITTYLDGAGNATITAADIDGGSTDNCSGLTLSASQTAFTCADIGSNNVTLTVTDGNSNTDNCVAVVTVVDTVSPTAVCQDITVFLDGSGNASIVAADVDGGSTDNCGAVTLSVSPTAFTCANIGANTVTLTVTDGSANVSTCTATVTVQDTVSPTAVCQNVTVFLDGAGNATIVASDIDGGSTDNCGSVTLNASTTAFTCADLGPNNVTLTVTDGSSNISTCTAVVTIADTMSPTVVCQNITVFLDGAGTATITAADIDGGATDNCGAVTPGASQTTFTCADLGANNVTLTVTDGSTNIATCVAVVTIMDTISPVITCPGNQTETPDASCQFTLPDYTALGIATDNCTAAPTVMQSPVAGTVISGTTTITLTSDDGNGNTSTCTFDVDLLDATAPTITCPGNQTEIADASCEVSLPDYTALATTTDNCDPSPTVSQSPAPGTTLSGAGTIQTITITSTDATGNSASCTFDVTVVDGTAPTIVCPGDMVEAADASCEVLLPDYTGFATTTDNCDASPVVTQSPVPGTTISGSGTVQIVTLTSTDAAGNSVSCTFNVTVVDGIEPIVTCPADITLECDQDNSPATAGTATAVDNCDASPVITFSDAITPGACPQESMITRTWTATDIDGNSASCDQVITIVDTQAPVITCPADITLECDQDNSPVGAGSATAVDNCDPAVVITFSDAAAPGACPQESVITRTWTATDACGNSSNCVQTITVVDTQAPVITCSGDMSFNNDPGTCGATAPAIGTATAVDNCDPAVAITNDAPGTFPLGATIVTWTATDACGNFATCMQTITVTDNEDPVTPTLADITAECTATATFPTTTDNCSGTITGTTTDPLTYTGEGTYTINWTFDDGNGNSIVVPQNVVIDDVTDPAVPTLNALTGNCSVVATAPTTTDNCAGTVTGTTTDPLTYIVAGTYTINWTFDDGNGNSITVPQTVTVNNSATTSSITEVVCNTYTAPSGAVYTTSGIYTDIIPNGAGCDSVITIDLTVNVDVYYNFSVTKCVEYTVPSGDETYYASGTYMDTIPTVNGCDSIMTIDVTIYTVDAGVTQSGITLTADASGGGVGYQWIDCNTMTDIVGASSQDFTPTYNGDFAVIVFQNGCSDTSACYNISTIGIDELVGNDLVLYPNPTYDGYFKVKYEGTIKALQVVDMLGRVISLPVDLQTGYVDGTQLESGKYMVRIVTENDTVIVQEVVVAR